VVYNVDLRKFFTPAEIAKILSEMPVIKTPIMDLVFPNRTNYDLPVLPAALIQKTIKSMPIVRRGGESIYAGSNTGTIDYFEPQPVILRDFLSAADLNNMKMLPFEGQRNYIMVKLSILREQIRYTAEALSAQSLTGKIEYAMKVDGGYIPYEVEYGTPTSQTLEKKWDADTTKLGDIILQLSDIVSGIQSRGYSGQIKHLVGKSGFAALANKIVSLSNDRRMGAEVAMDKITFPGVEIYLVGTTYTDRNVSTGAEVTKQSIANTALVSVPVDQSSFYYAAIDDLDAGLVGLPFFAKEIKTDDPSGYKILAQSKPFPVPAVPGITISTVTST
jgi:hypothetical protein